MRTNLSHLPCSHHRSEFSGQDTKPPNPGFQLKPPWPIFVYTESCSERLNETLHKCMQRNAFKLIEFIHIIQRFFFRSFHSEISKIIFWLFFHNIADQSDTIYATIIDKTVEHHTNATATLQRFTFSCNPENFHTPIMSKAFSEMIPQFAQPT